MTYFQDRNGTSMGDPSKTDANDGKRVDAVTGKPFKKGAILKELPAHNPDQGIFPRTKNEAMFKNLRDSEISDGSI